MVDLKAAKLADNLAVPMVLKKAVLSAVRLVAKLVVKKVAD
jgi:hypothetical protein